MPNKGVERTAGSHSLAAAAYRPRSAAFRRVWANRFRLVSAARAIFIIEAFWRTPEGGGHGGIPAKISHV